MKIPISKVVLLMTIIPLLVTVFSLSVLADSSSIPVWVKNNAKWWSEGSISEVEYLKSLEYLITKGIINIPQKIEVTAAQTPLTDDERAQFFVVHFSDGLIEKPFTVYTFSKFESTSSQSKGTELFKFPMYYFKDKAEFLLEGLPSVDKKDLYRGIDRWMTRGTTLSPFAVDIDVVAGDGTVIQTWTYTNCQPTAYGTYLQDVINFYQYSGQNKSEIRDRVAFSCTSVLLEVP
ncbi:MAG: hypothetical protein XU09_C0001G0228 [Thaumarchaeota archaeon CSP1-1]|nr:MAG: hypothetical protein XU09_C0001G0228 [Thaumarchaeota archaeon CSP1-1]